MFSLLLRWPDNVHSGCCTYCCCSARARDTDGWLGWSVPVRPSCGLDTRKFWPPTTRPLAGQSFPAPRSSSPTVRARDQSQKSKSWRGSSSSDRWLGSLHIRITMIHRRARNNNHYSVIFQEEEEERAWFHPGKLGSGDVRERGPAAAAVMWGSPSKRRRSLGN